MELMEREGALFQKLTDDGQEMVVYRMIYNDRICLGSPTDPWGYNRGWCVPLGRGVEIAEGWDGRGDPPHWIKEVGTDRRSRDETAEAGDRGAGRDHPRGGDG